MLTNTEQLLVIAMTAFAVGAIGELVVKMASGRVSFSKHILIIVGWTNICPVIVLGWLAIGGKLIAEAQIVGALVVSMVGFAMLFILYTPVEEDRHGRH